MDLRDSYILLEVSESSSNDEIINSFKRLALLYHPDKNRDKTEWATEAMTKINVAYALVMSHRFKDPGGLHEDIYTNDAKTGDRRRDNRSSAEHTERNRKADDRELYSRDEIINRFAEIKDFAKDALYRYFQYGLYNLIRRENALQKRIFREVVVNLRKSFHAVRKLSKYTRDEEILEHINVFSLMAFNFYKASECLNILDSYSNIIDVEAYRLYKRGDESLHMSHKEIFYDRHNRGHYRKDIALPYLFKSENYFVETLKGFPDSTWSVETNIKLGYVHTLQKYLQLFFY